MSRCFLTFIAGACFVIPCARPVLGQTLSLSSANTTSGSTVSLNLAFSSGGNSVAALQWTFQYPASGISAIRATAGAALTAAGKSLTCSAGSGSYTCIAYGMNATTIASGVAATITVTVSTTSPLNIVNTVAASPAGASVPLTGSAGTVTVGSPPPAPTLSSLSCTPTSLSGASSSTCTVTLNAAATVATSVALSSNNTAVVVPHSVTILAGSSSAEFAAVANSSLNATVILTAAAGGIIKATSLALTTSTFSLRVRAGGAAYTDEQGFTWEADTGAVGGTPWSTKKTVAKTKAVPLYQALRYGLSAYQFNVPNGNYTVNLKFAETSRTSIGQRVFSVTLNGVLVLSNFDITVAAGGPLVAIDKPFPVSVTNGKIQIGFIKQVDNPMVNAIEIVQEGAPLSQTAAFTTASVTTLNINSGGPAYTDPQGTVWGADQHFTGGSTWSTTHTVSNTTSPKLYASCRYGEFYYSTELPNGKYIVTLKFAEISKTGAGQRVFDVQINGVPVLKNFDIIHAVGAPFVADDKTFPVTVSNGVLVIGFTPGAEDLPLVNGIQIAKVN